MTIGIGDIRIDRVPEMEVPFRTAAELFAADTEDALDAHRHWLEPWALCPDSGRLIIAVQSYLVRTTRHVVLIDTCVGCDKSNAWHPPWDRRTDRGWLDRLATAGAAPEEIDFVCCTHLHSDHCGWNTKLVDDRWVPTFPNAKYILARSEVDHVAAADLVQYGESVLPVIEAGQAVLVDTDHAVDDEIRLEPAPGHTPGHYAVALASNGREAVMCGDLIHSPVQCLYPDWRYRIDDDPVQGNATRRAFLDTNCGRDRLVMTAHFPSPSMGHVVADGDAFRFRFLS